MRQIFILLILASVIIGCQEKLGKDEIVPTSSFIVTDSIFNVPCVYSNFAEADGTQLKYNGDFTITRTKRAEYEEILITWRNNQEMIIRYNDPLGFKHAMERGRKVDLWMAQKLEVDLSYYDFGNTYTENADGDIYLVPQNDGSLDITWCQLKFYFWRGDVFSKGGISIIP